MRDALKTIAGYRNQSALQDRAQAAARLARETLDELGLFGASEPGQDASDASV